MNRRTIFVVAGTLLLLSLQVKLVVPAERALSDRPGEHGSWGRNDFSRWLQVFLFGEFNKELLHLSEQVPRLSAMHMDALPLGRGAEGMT